MEAVNPVHVTVMAFCQKGAEITLVGSCPALGAWDPNKAVRMTEHPKGSGQYIAGMLLTAGKVDLY